MAEHTDRTSEETPSAPDQPNLWIGPLLLVAALSTVILILVFSNTGETAVNWANWAISAPLWMVLLVTFAAGLIASPLFGRVWRAFRKRRRRLKDESAA